MRSAWWKVGSLLVGAASSGVAWAQSGFLHASGTQILDGSNNIVQLKGVNLGNWLFIEPWMWGTFTFGSYMDSQGEQDKLATYLSANLTPNQINLFWQKYRTNAITQQDIQKIKSYGWNCVRVPFDYRLFLDKSTGNLLTENFVYLDNLLAWCQVSGVYAILDMHSVPGSAYSWSSTNAYSNASNLALYTKAWKAIASRYANSPSVAAYDLVNEPVSSGDSRLRDMQVAATTAIRQVDPNHMVFAEGDYYASQLDILGAPWDSNLGFSDHNYASTLPNNLPHDQELATRYNIPLWMGEYGYNSNNWINQQMGLLNAVNTVNSRSIQSHWTLWSWKSSSVWSPLKYGSFQKFQKVLDSVNNGTTLSSADLFTGLLELADNVSYSKCTVNANVLDALTRPTFATTAVPSANLSIPGTIRAVQYDFGPEGIAYHDSLSSNTGGMGSGFQSWNTGWITRNDGVDLVTWKDTSLRTKTSTGIVKSAIGYIDAGEWTQYTTQVTPGNYQVQITYSGPGGDLHIEVGGANASGTITLPPSPNGDWSRFSTFTVPNVTVTSFGQVPVRLVFDKPSYNIDSVRFTALNSVPTGQTLTILAESNNAFVTTQGPQLVSSEAAAGTASKFTLLSVGNGLYTIQNTVTGLYIGLAASGGRLDPTIVSSANAARFRWIGLGGSRLNLFCETNRQYVCADQFLGTPPVLAANRSAPQGWESFQYTLIGSKRTTK